MSAISQKSISGITSITTPAGVDNVFTVHTNDTTERFRVDSTGSLNIAGISTFSEGIFIPDDKKLSIGNASGNNGDLQLFHTNNNSYVRDFGTGSLLIQGSGVYIQNSNGGTNIASFLENTGVSIPLDLDVDGHTELDNVNIVGVTTIRNASGTKLYEGVANGSKLFHAGTERLSTETYGIDINGTLGADQVNCSGISTFANDVKLSDTEGKIEATGSTGLTLNASGGSAYARIRTAGSERVRITNTGQVGINTSSLNHLFEVHALGNDANNLQQIVFEKKSSANNKQAFGLTIRSNAQTSSGNEPTAFLRFDARPSSLNGSHGGNAIIAFSPIGVTQGTYGKGNLDFYIRSGGPYTFQNDPGGAGEMQPKLRIDPEGRVMMGGATSAHGSTNRDDLVIGAVNQANQTGITIGSASASGISFADAGNDTAGGIYYSHGNDDMIFYAGGNQRGKVKDDSGITGIEHHRFIPFLIGYDVQNTTNITMSKGFGGMSQIAMNADGDKAYMSYVTHWRHRQYAGVYFWYGASGNTSGATFDWDFTVWNAGSGIGYSQSSHTFTVTSGTMSNGKMYRLNATSSWPTHAATKFVQFEIDFDELQNGTSLQLSGMELIEYTTP